MANSNTRYFRNSSRYVILLILVVIGIIILFSTTKSGFHFSKKSRSCSHLQKLWYDHVLWTHKYILAAVHDLPDKNESATRLLANQRELAYAILPSSSTGELQRLLEEHIVIATKIVAAAISGNTNDVQMYSAEWSNNAHMIAKYLAQHGVGTYHTNRKMMEHHLSVTLQEATAIISKNSSDEVKYLDMAVNQSLDMAKALCK